MNNQQMTIALTSILLVLILAFVFPVGAIFVATVGAVAFFLKRNP